MICREMVSFNFMQSTFWKSTYAVPQPVASGRETDTTGTDRNGEDLANENPGSWTPGGSEEEDIDANEGNQGSGCVLVVGEGGSDSTDNKLADDHAQGSVDHDGATAETLNGPEGNRGGDDIDNGENHGNQERVVDRAKGLQEDRGVVEDEVDTGPLLHHLEGSSENRATEVRPWVGESTLEAVCPGRDVPALRDDLHLILVVGNNLGEFLLNVVRVDGLATNASKDCSSVHKVTLLDEVAGRLRKEEETEAKNHGWEELDSDGDAV